MIPAPVIAILGLSGSGKSHLGRSIVRARPEILRLSAGSLLRGSLHTSGEKLRMADSENVRENQTGLAEALQVARMGQLDRLVLLEAHSFIDNDRELIDVPTSVMASLRLAGIVLIDTPVEKIAMQRQQDRRKRPLRSVDELAQHAVRSRKLAQEYADKLGIPLITVDASERDRVLEFIDLIQASQC